MSFEMKALNVLHQLLRILKVEEREVLKFNVSVRSLKTGDNLEVDLINFCLQLVSPDSISLFMAMSPLPPQYVLHSNAYLLTLKTAAYFPF